MALAVATLDRPRLVTERLVLGIPSPADAEAARDFFIDNRAHLERWVPPFEPEMNRLEWWAEELFRLEQAYRRGESARFFIRLRDSASAEIIGHRSLTRIRRGQDCSCTLSGAIAHKHTRRGYATEAGRAVIQYAFETLGLHRIDAGYDVDNPGSPNVLRNLGFTTIGRAADFRFVGGAWRDYILTQLTNPDAPAPEPTHMPHA